MILRLATCTLRPWRAGDEVTLVPHANDRRVWRNLRDRFPHPYTANDAVQWVRMASLLTDSQFAIEVEGAAVGGIGFEQLDDVYRVGAELGYWLGAELWGRGIMTEAVRAVAAHAFAAAEIDRLQAGVFSWNAASMRVLEKAGFVREGTYRRAVLKDGAIGDLVMFVRLRG
jgi:RimJ/RimL family protein N-acetyltransferase